MIEACAIIFRVGRGNLSFCTASVESRLKDLVGTRTSRTSAKSQHRTSAPVSPPSMPEQVQRHHLPVQALQQRLRGELQRDHRGRAGDIDASRRPAPSSDPHLRQAARKACAAHQAVANQTGTGVAAKGRHGLVAGPFVPVTAFLAAQFQGVVRRRHHPVERLEHLRRDASICGWAPGGVKQYLARAADDSQEFVQDSPFG